MKTIIESAGDHIVRGTLRFYSSGQIGVSLTEDSRKELRYKYIVFDSIDTYDTFERIASNTYITSNYCAGDPVYVHPDARLSRDLIRKSGYNITRSKDKAELIIIPQPKYESFIDMKYHIACREGGIIYLFSVRDEYGIDIPEEKLDDCKERITQFLGNDQIEFISCSLDTLMTCTFFPKVEEYKELIENDKPQKYVFDTKIQLQPNVDISVETLDVWARLSDNNMLSRFICASNWKDYPFTLRMFIDAEQYGLRYQSNKNIRMILEELGVGKSIPGNLIVSKKDYDLFISYVFHKLGRNPSASYIEPDELRKLPDEYRQFIKMKFAIAPKTIDGDEIYANIINKN